MSNHSRMFPCVIVTFLYLDNVNYTFGKLSPGLEQFLSEVGGTLPMSSSSLQQGIPASWLIKCPGLQLSS